MSQRQAEDENQLALEEAANMNFGARFVNHLLTPGSALSGTMQTAFNGIMVILFLTWGIFLGSMPDSIHVWIFGFLILGLTLSTNWFMSEVIKIKEDIKKEEEEEKKNKKPKEVEGGSASGESVAAPAAVEENKTTNTTEEKVDEQKSNDNNQEDETMRNRKEKNEVTSPTKKARQSKKEM